MEYVHFNMKNTNTATTNQISLKNETEDENDLLNFKKRIRNGKERRRKTTTTKKMENGE